MKYGIYLILLILPRLATAQAPYLILETVNFGEAFAFPVVVSGDSLARTKLNVHMQLSELEYISDKNDASMFGKITEKRGGLYGTKESVQPVILQNSSRVLSVQLFQSSCGLTCHYWGRYYNFNPHNGDRYFLPDFFSQEHFTEFRKLVARVRKENLAAQIKARIEADIRDTVLQDMERYMYEEIATDGLDDFYFDEDLIYFDNYNLLSKRDQHYDLDQETAIEIDSIRHLLNDYGVSALITGKDLANFRAVSEPQLYEGNIGKYPVYLLFRHAYDNSYYGIYAYKSHRTGIDLDGDLWQGTYTLSEKHKDFDETAVLTFKKERDTLTGHWTARAKGNRLLFSAVRK